MIKAENNLPNLIKYIGKADNIHKDIRNKANVCINNLKCEGPGGVPSLDDSLVRPEDRIPPLRLGWASSLVLYKGERRDLSCIKR